MENKDAPELLIPFARKNPTLESAKAEAMFKKFMAGAFSYDELSNHPDYPVYASAEVLVAILPLIIDAMVARGDTENFLIYQVISAVDPFGEGEACIAERTNKLITLLDKKTADKIFKLLTTIKEDPPVPVERLDRITDFWRGNCSQRLGI